MRPLFAVVADGLPISLKAFFEHRVFQLNEVERDEMRRPGREGLINS